jgi:DNA invertase Pin-like site-specific DNA recombinase
MTHLAPLPDGVRPALEALAQWRDASRALLLGDGLTPLDPEQARAVLAAHGHLARLLAELFSDARAYVPRGRTQPPVRKALIEAERAAQTVSVRAAFTGHPTAWDTSLPFPQYTDYIPEPRPATVDPATYRVRGSLPCPDGAGIDPLFHHNYVAMPTSADLDAYGLIWCQGLEAPVGRVGAWTQDLHPGVVLIDGSVLPHKLPPSPGGWTVSPQFRVLDDGRQVLTRITLVPAPLQVPAAPPWTGARLVKTTGLSVGEARAADPSPRPARHREGKGMNTRHRHHCDRAFTAASRAIDTYSVMLLAELTQAAQSLEPVMPERARTLLARQHSLLAASNDLMDHFHALVPPASVPDHVAAAFLDVTRHQRAAHRLLQFAAHPTVWDTSLPYPDFTEHIPAERMPRAHLTNTGRRVRVRPKFEEALRTAREVKAHAPHCRVIFTVYEMKRLGRDAAELTALADHLTAHGLVLEMLAGPLPGIYDPTGPGKLLFAFFAAMAETERENIRESTLEGLDTAARKGKHGGRPPVITEDMLHTVLRRRANGESVEQIQPDLIIPTGKRKGQNPSVASIYRALAEHGKREAYPEAIEASHADFAALQAGAVPEPRTGAAAVATG